MTSMNFHPAVFNAFRLGTKTYLRTKPVSNPIIHVAGAVTVLVIASIASFVVGGELDRAATVHSNTLMATFAVPSPYYGATINPPEIAIVDEASLENEVSAR